MTVKPSMILERDNVYLPEGSGRAMGFLSILIGLALTGVCLFAAFTGEAERAKQALTAYHVGFLITIGFSITGLGFVMILQQTNAGWTATIRRQFENLMRLAWVGGLFFLGGIGLQAVLAGKGVYLYSWMDSAHTAGDLLYSKKAGFLNVPFFLIRAAAYFAVWLGLGHFLWSWSTRQDRDGDKWLTAYSRKLSAPGLVLFALATAFAGFDWVMSLDYHWYSTMLGVWFFAANMVSTMAMGTLALLTLRSFGRLRGAFTDEHLHDLGKLLFAFTVFWAYISFSQYFLIWYANIPEETAYFVIRKQGNWEPLSWAIPIGHFIIPFIWLIPRPWRRRSWQIGIACVWLLVMHMVDVFWYVRPVAGPVETSTLWIDLTGILGPVLVFVGFFILKIASGPLMPLRDPRQDEALHHKNYV